jgi:Lrp/AsnC family transcriptional regulator for asnA, asnC and gidA
MLKLLLNVYEVKMIDELDRKLIQELQKSGRQEYVAIAKMFGVVEGTVRKRVKDLVDKNVIKIVAVPNPRALGYSFLSIMGLQVRMADLRKVADNLAQKPNVCYLAFVTGRYDLMAIIMTRSSEELSRFIENEISALPSILRTETFVNLDIIKGGWPGLDTTQLISNIDISLPKGKRKME